MAEEKKVYTEEETREYYTSLIAAIINGDEEKKKQLDVCATKLLTTMRTSFPTIGDKVLATFASSCAYLFAQVMQVQTRDLSVFVEHTFNDYMVVSATLLGAYDPMSTEVPKAPEVKTPEEMPVVVDEDYRPGNYL
jgi:hypothetical protein